METFSALMAICAGNSPVPGEFPTQRPLTRSFDVYPDLRPNKRLSKQSRGWWFETLSHPLWRHRNDSRSTEEKPMTSSILNEHGKRHYNACGIWEVRDHSVHALIQLDTTLHCNIVSHWLCAYTKRSFGSTRYLIQLTSNNIFSQKQHTMASSEIS